MRKLIFILIAILVIGLAGTLIITSLSGGFGFKTVAIHEKELLEIDKIEQIVISHPSTDVNIIPTKNEKMTVELNGKVSKKFKDQYKLEVKENGEEVKIAVNRDDNDWTPGFGINVINVNLDIKLPEKIYESIDIDLASGDINLTDIKAKEVSLNTMSGDIDVKKSEAEKTFTSHSLSGDIMLQNLKAEKLQVDVTSGDTEINQTETKSVMISSTSGDVDLNNVKGDMDVGVMSGDIEIANEEMNADMTIESASGDVDIQFNQKPQSLTLNYDGVSGVGTVQLDGMLYENKLDHFIKGTIGNGEHLLEVRTSSGDFNLR